MEGRSALRVARRICESKDKHLNYGLHDITYNYSWVYLCYADERVPARLAQELISKASDTSAADGAYRVRSRGCRPR